MQGTAAASGWLGDAENGAPVGLFRAHFDNLPGPGYIWQRCSADDFRLIAHNRAAAHLGNGEIRGLLGVRTSELFKDRPDIRATIVQSARNREITLQETDMPLVSGATRRMRATLLPMSSDIVVVHLDDVTEQRAAEDALRASERRFRALFQSHPDVTFRMDVVGNYLDMHVPEGAVASMQPADVVGKNIGDLFGADAAASHWHYAREAIRTDAVQVLEYDVRINGRDTRVESRMVRSGDDEVVITVRDITNEVDVEQSVAAARDRERRELGQALQNQLSQVRLRLDELSSAAAVTTGSAAHEPATTLADRLAALETAIADAHEIAYDLDPVPAGTPLVAALRSLVARSEQTFGIACRLSCGDAVPPMLEQVPDLHRIVQEAVASAAEHGAASNVEIICSAINGQLVLNIADDGSGFRLSSSDQAAYGMRVIRHRTKRLGGTLLRSRRTAGGTLLTLTCPVPRDRASAK